MKPSTSRTSRSQHGFALIMVLFIVVVLLLVAVAVLTNSSYSANDSLSVQTKNQTFDAAEAGLNVAQWDLDENLSAADGTRDTSTLTVDGYRYHWEIVGNRLSASGPAVADPDPQQTAPITVPAGQALLAGWASSITGGRTVYVEELVTLAAPTYITPGAIVCGKTATISHQQIYDTSGHHSANILCGTIVASGGGQIPQGMSMAFSGSNAITGYDGHAYTGATPPTFLTAAQLAIVQNNTLQQAKSGGANFYTAGDVSSGTIGSSGASCVAYIGGSIILKGSSTLINYCATTVVMGDITISGSANYQSLPATLTHIMYVFGSGGNVLQGTPTTVGIIYAANSDVTINGSGTGNFTGSVITPDSVTMNGGGSGSFDYDGTHTPPPFVPHYVDPRSQWEY
jgi:PilX N-terminal